MNGLTTLAARRAPDILNLMSSLSDATRARLLLVLEGQEFTVSELCTILQLPQSTVSRHLKVLSDEHWLESRPDGTSRRYRMRVGGEESDAANLWLLVRQRVSDLPAARQDALRVRSVVAGRRTRSQEFFASAAGDWDSVRTQMFGAHVDLLALLGLIDSEWTLGDLGCGTGRISAALAPFVRRVIAVDGSREMIAAAQASLEGVDNVELRQGDLELLPLADRELDAAVLCLVLHHVVEPERVLAEAARTIKPGGRLLLADVTPHDRRSYEHDMGHVWLGFSAEQLADWLAATGFEDLKYRELDPDPDATGPAIFAASARRIR